MNSQTFFEHDFRFSKIVNAFSGSSKRSHDILLSMVFALFRMKTTNPSQLVFYFFICRDISSSLEYCILFHLGYRSRDILLSIIFLPAMRAEENDDYTIFLNW